MTRRVLNAAEGSLRNCSECVFNQENPRLQESCESGLWVSWGVARCNSQDQEAGMDRVREGASIVSLGRAGVDITYDEEGLLFKGQYRVHPSFSEKMLARIGINEAMWNPGEI